eukprot:TRINITY_DN31402_c0_g1_i1.p1 TRINITY_DN31402_c0_g1~~TRINITY_DN31402_c0_g1_i1.p1  ORF type:complete len:468 (-),score=31.63 TRINITY_DN31402_c0_g1_i1:34-1437(-)
MAAAQPAVCGAPRETRERHLVVLCHGLLGSAADWKGWISAWRVLQSAAVPLGSFDTSCRTAADLPTDLLAVDMPGITRTGIRALAERAAEQVETELVAADRSGRPYARFSILAHSLGGIYSKLLLTLRHEEMPSLCGELDGAKRFPLFSLLKLVNFMTFATPHLSSRRPVRWFAARAVTNILVGRTGQELLLRDTGQAVLRATHESVPELKRAEGRLVSFANNSGDVVVPHATSILHLRKSRRLGACKINAEKGLTRGAVRYVHLPGVCRCFESVNSLSNKEGLPGFAVSDIEGFQPNPPPPSPIESRSEDTGNGPNSSCPEVSAPAQSKPNNAQTRSRSARERVSALLPVPFSARSRRSQSAHARSGSPNRPERNEEFESDEVTAQNGKEQGRNARGLPSLRTDAKAEEIRQIFGALDPLGWVRVDVRIVSPFSHERIILKGATEADLAVTGLRPIVETAMALFVS